MANSSHNKYRKSHWKMDYYEAQPESLPCKKARLRRALKKKVKREILNDLSK